MPRIKKFNFQKILMSPPVEDTSAYTLSISKNGQMVINRAAVQKFGFDGALVDVVYDPEKRALGLKRLNGHTLPESSWSKTMRLIKADPKTGLARVSVGRILSRLGLGGVSYPGLVIDSYQDIMEQYKIYFVILPKTPHDSNGNKEVSEE